MVTPPPMGDPAAAGPMPLRRLTRREYNNTVRDLLGDAGNRADSFPLDRDSEFLFRRSGLVSMQDADTLEDAAEATAAAIASKVAALAPCMGAAEDACARKFVTDFGLRAYRRPVVAEETERLMALYTAGRTQLMLSYAGAIQLMVEGILQSPAFLYHWELGYAAPTVDGKVVRLNGYETASRLSYLLWGSLPDAALFEAARTDQLTTQMQLEGQARRMLADPRARESVIGFVEEWLSLDQITERPKDPMVYPEWTDPLKTAMVAEVRAFVASAAFDNGAKFSAVLLGTNSYLTQALANVYGVRGVTGMMARDAALDASQRAGLLTRAGWLTVTGATNGSHPIKRGHQIYERVLCGDLPPPPNNVPEAKSPSEAGTTRQHVEEHDKNPCAAACHQLMDPVGFAFEHYDGIGKYRTTENGLMVDSSGAIELDGAEVKFADARDLSQAFAKSPTVAQCFATQWLRFAFKRAETEADRASLEAMDAAFAKGGSITDLLVGLVGSRTFRYRTPGVGEKLQ